MEKVRFIYVERKNNSVYGNPAWSVLFEDKAGKIIKARTATNAACGYQITWTMGNTFQEIAYHVTKAGNVIIDRMKPNWIG